MVVVVVVVVVMAVVMVVDVVMMMGEFNSIQYISMQSKLRVLNAIVLYVLYSRNKVL